MITTFYELLKSCCDKYGDKTAVVYDTLEITYAKLFEDCVNKALHLQKFEGDRIAIYGPASYRWIVNSFGTVLAGKDAIFVDFFLPKGVREQLLEKSKADYILCSTNQYILSDSKANILTYAEKDEVEGLSYDTATKEGKLLFFTATENESDKAVVLNVKNILNTIRGINRFCECTSDDRVLSQINLDHVFGYIYALMWPLYNGACVCVGRGLRHIDSDTYYYNPTILPGHPSMVEYLKKIKGFNDGLKMVIIGGAACPFRLFESLKDRDLDVYTVYGMTETASSFAINYEMDGSFEIVDEGSVKLADDGEILVSGDSIMECYDKDAEATQRVLKNGVLHTGDYGRFNSRGNLVITRRNPHIILLPTGEKICREVTMREIEALSGIKESYIELYEDKLTAIIVPFDKNSRDEKYKRLLNKYNEQKGYRWEIQRVIIRHEALPKNADGTVDTDVLEDIISEAAENTEQTTGFNII